MVLKCKQINLGLKVTIRATGVILLLGAVSGLQQKWILSGVIIWFFGWLTVYWLTKHVTGPLTELAAAMKTLAHGDSHNTRALTSHVFEVRELIAAFNSLRLDIQKFRSEAEFINMKRKKILGKIMNVQEEERKKISRELHDQVGQYLTAMNLELRVIDDLTGSKKVRERTQNIRVMIDHTQKYIKNLIWELRPSSLDDVGLEAAITRHLLSPLNRAGINADIQAYAMEGMALPPEVSTCAFRVAQESVNNAVKHGIANNISIVLLKHAGYFSIVIEDDGKGFEVDEVLNNAIYSRKFGLLGMEERALLVNGQLIIESGPGNGTTIYLKIPLNREEVNGENQGVTG